MDSKGVTFNWGSGALRVTRTIPLPLEIPPRIVNETVSPEYLIAPVLNEELVVTVTETDEPEESSAEPLAT